MKTPCTVVKDKEDNLYLAVELDNDIFYFKIESYDTEIESDIDILSKPFFVNLTKEE